MSKNIVTLKSGSEVTESGTIRQIAYSFLSVFYSKFVPKKHPFEIFHVTEDIATCTYTVTLKPGLGVTQGHQNRCTRGSTRLGVQDRGSYCWLFTP